jgi:hypothetical protein
VLKPGGLFLSVKPAYPHAALLSDPTHVSIIREDTFRCQVDNERSWTSD